jgi:hypothetical protein
METTIKNRKYQYASDVHHIHQLSDCPAELWSISMKWRDLSNAHGDEGSCVLGAGFLFKYQHKWFFMGPLCMWQGSCSWEVYKDTIQTDLENLGVTDLLYEWGNMD